MKNFLADFFGKFGKKTELANEEDNLFFDDDAFIDQVERIAAYGVDTGTDYDDRTGCINDGTEWNSGSSGGSSGSNNSGSSGGSSGSGNSGINDTPGIEDYGESDNFVDESYYDDGFTIIDGEETWIDDDTLKFW